MTRPNPTSPVQHGLRILAVAPLVCAATIGSARAQSVQLQPPQAYDAGFGAALALHDGTLLAGAVGDPDLGVAQGAVYVFSLESGAWVAAGRLPAPAAAPGFGSAVALGAHGALIGQPGFSSPVLRAGRVYSLGFDPGMDVRVVQYEGRGVGAAFGSAIALADERAVAGAPGAVQDSGKTGAAVLFAYRRGQWRYETTLRDPEIRGRDAFGASVALEGCFTAVGAPAGVGAVYVFEGTRGSGAVARLTAPVRMARTAFGASVALDGGRLFVGAPRALVGGVRAGAVFVFGSDGTRSWELLQTLVPVRRSAGASFGTSVAADQGMVAIGVPGDDVMGRDSGSVSVFRTDESGALQAVADLAVPSRGGGDSMGAAVALHAGWLAVGAPGAAGGIGRVHLYRTDGLLRPPEIAFELVAHASDGAAASRFNALALDPQGFLLAGLFRGGVDVFDGARFHHHRFDPGDPGSISDDGVLALRVDRRDRIWVGTENGLNRFDRSRDRFVRYRLQPDSSDAEPVVALYEDRRGVVWTGSNGRLYRYERETDAFVGLEAFAAEPHLLAETYISGIQGDSRGRLWVLAKNLWENHASLYRVDPAGATVERFPLAPEWGQVGPLLVDRSDRLWIKAPAPVPLPTRPGEMIYPPEKVSTAMHWAFLQDRSGVVWIATRRGLYRAPPGAEVASLHRIAPSRSPLQSWDEIFSLIQEPQGTVLTGTAGGVYRVRWTPRDGLRQAGISAIDAGRAASLALTEITVNGRDGAREVMAYGLSSLDLGSDDYGVEFRFALVDLHRSVHARIRYRLTGFDRSWIEATGELRAGYTSIPPGRYTFEAVAEPVGGGSVSRLALPLHVPTPYWQTWWFRGLVLVAFGIAVAVAYRSRVAQRAAVAAMRERIAQDLHDDLSTNLSGIALLSERLGDRGGIGAEREALRGIGAAARAMLGDLRDMVWLVDPGHDSVQELLLKMRDIAEALLGDAYEIRGDSLEALRQIDIAQRREWLLAYKELLHNVVRHARARRVRITLAAEDGWLRLEVVDDGDGFDPEVHTEGHGLRNLRARAARLGGHLSLSSRPGEGTRAVFRLPLR